ncbi:hypothetical protein HK099_007854 [Clydaea vesicula]|uniref:Uncharacterized protein n=1 Tax=Clydaea vesicula TaxID=447962 RepID=A0AAD5UBX6_9FUNG|nr:hypothetical protein HK099_007854 [Clydaea vesicula]KAJ3396679.1 hypothetical protein HDU92_002305 [Lobulomyces angularis]
MTMTVEDPTITEKISQKGAEIYHTLHDTIFPPKSNSETLKDNINSTKANVSKGAEKSQDNLSYGIEKTREGLEASRDNLNSGIEKTKDYVNNGLERSKGAADYLPEEDDDIFLNTNDDLFIDDVQPATFLG